MNARPIAALLALALSPSLARTQYTAPRWQPEYRLEVLAARSTAVHAAAGANAALGTYLRLGLLAGAGARRTGDAWRTSGSASAVARFHLDPFREFRHGLYAGGGGALMLDQNSSSRVLAVAVIGYEGAPTRSRWIVGAELGVGGGARIGVTLRRARERGR